MTRSTHHYILLAAFAIANTTGISFKCEPCHWDYCSFSTDADPTVNIEVLGSMKCSEIETKASNGEFVQDECGYITAVTMDASNPCGCHLTGTSDPCPDPPTDELPDCNVCSSGVDIVGDPGRVVQSNSFFAGFTCGELESVAMQSAFDAANCETVKLDMIDYCQCYNPYTEPEPRQCVPQYGDCDPDNDTCCIGNCVWRGKNVCSVNPAYPTQSPVDTPESSPPSIQASEVPSASPIPSSVPTEAPITQALGGGAISCAAATESCQDTDCCGSLVCEAKSRDQLELVCKPPAGGDGKCGKSVRRSGYGGSGGGC